MSHASNPIRFAVSLAAIAVASLIAGCGNDVAESDDSSDETTSAEGSDTSAAAATTAAPSNDGEGPVSRDEFVEQFATSAAGPGSPFTDDQATCLGEKIYDEVGSEAIGELSAEATGAFPEELIEPVAKVGPECVAAGDLMEEQLGTAGLTPEQTDCIVSGINDDPALNQQVWDAIAAAAGGDESKAEDLEGAIGETAASCA